MGKSNFHNNDVINQKPSFQQQPITKHTKKEESLHNSKGKKTIAERLMEIILEKDFKTTDLGVPRWLSQVSNRLLISAQFMILESEVGTPAPVSALSRESAQGLSPSAPPPLFLSLLNKSLKILKNKTTDLKMLKTKGRYGERQ